ncbi:uncharacterized protein LOC135357803 [Latimeria chalumnae]|uniref:uncharacterized protein LOC135357803 n=1 Tax=Latimeria chalumnae TaxID=7897 RepID=UPI00313F1276
MNWDTQLRSILNATDNNVSKIRQRLNSGGSLPRDAQFDRIRLKNSQFVEPPGVQFQTSAFYSDPPSHRMPKEDLMGVYGQLQTQDKTIASLNQTVARLENENEQQQQRIRTLEEEVHRLWNRSHDRSSDLQLERKVEQWRREVSHELYSLRDEVRRQAESGVTQGRQAVSGVTQDLNESKKFLWEECGALRREIDSIKHKLISYSDRPGWWTVPRRLVVFQNSLQTAVPRQSAVSTGVDKLIKPGGRQDRA